MKHSIGAATSTMLIAIMLQCVVAPNSGERNNVLEEKDREIAVLRRRIIELEGQLYGKSEQNTSAQEGKLNHDSMSTNRAQFRSNDTSHEHQECYSTDDQNHIAVNAIQ